MYFVCKIKYFSTIKFSVYINFSALSVCLCLHASFFLVAFHHDDQSTHRHITLVLRYCRRKSELHTITVTLSHYHTITVTLSHYHTITVTPSHHHTVTTQLAHCQTITPSHLSHTLTIITVTHSHYHCLTPSSLVQDISSSYILLVLSTYLFYWYYPHTYSTGIHYPHTYSTGTIHIPILLVLSTYLFYWYYPHTYSTGTIHIPILLVLSTYLFYWYYPHTYSTGTIHIPILAILLSAMLRCSNSVQCCRPCIEASLLSLISRNLS